MPPATAAAMRSALERNPAFGPGRTTQLFTAEGNELHGDVGGWRRLSTTPAWIACCRLALQFIETSTVVTMHENGEHTELSRMLVSPIPDLLTLKDISRALEAAGFTVDLIRAFVALPEAPPSPTRGATKQQQAAAAAAAVVPQVLGGPRYLCIATVCSASLLLHSVYMTVPATQAMPLTSCSPVCAAGAGRPHAGG